MATSLLALDTAESQRVLLVDHDRSPGLAERLRISGIDVVSPADPVVAQREMAEGGFSVVIGDWNNGGRELLAQARSDPESDYVSVILLGDDESQLEQAMQLGADDFLIHPVDPPLLAARMLVARQIGQMQREIAQKNFALTETNRRLEQVNERMRRELNAAARVQQALLPSPAFRAPGVEIGWKLRPCDELAGDLFNVLRLDEHHLAFFVLDVSGHGVSSALLSVQVSRLMSPMMTESELLKRRLPEPPWYEVVEPLSVVRRLNELFPTSGEMTHYFTIVYGVLHLASGHMRLATAGHPGPVVVTARGEARGICSRSNPVGLLDDPEFATHELQLDPGEDLWLFSDGLTDAFDTDERMLGEPRLRELFGRMRDRPAQAAVDSVLRSVERWCSPEEPDDDCSLIAIRRMPPDATA